MVSCSQCGRPAITLVGDNDIPLCVDCYYKLIQATKTKDEMLVRELNYLSDMMEAVTGVHGILPRYRTPQPLLHQGPITSIRIDRSIVGAVNSGEIERLEIAMSHMQISGAEKLVEAVKEMTEAVLAVKELGERQKNDLVEQLRFLLDQARISGENRQPGMIRAAACAIKDTVTTVPGLVVLWERLRPLLEQVLE